MAKAKKVVETISTQETLIKYLQAQVHDLYAFCVEWRKQNDALKAENLNLHYQVIKLICVISYLENQREANPVRS